MQIDFLMVLITVLSLVLLIIPGFLLAKTKLITQQASSFFSAMVLYGCQPLLMIMSFQKATFSSQILINMAIVFALALLVHFIMIGVQF
jgi:predicted permease